MSTTKVVMSVDPSINNLGCAIFRHERKSLIYAEVLHPKKDERETFEEKCFSLYITIDDLVEVHRVTEIVMEMPEHWDVAGFMSRESGAIHKVTFMAGMLYSFRIKMPVVTVVPRLWKGQLPKDVTRNRLQKFYVPKYYTVEEWKALNHNTLDAIGIGHWRLHGRV